MAITFSQSPDFCNQQSKKIQFTIILRWGRKTCVFLGNVMRLRPHYYTLVLKRITFATFTPAIHTTSEFQSP